MDKTKKQQAVLYLEGGRFFFYPDTSGNVSQVVFTPDVVSDLEVLNKQKLILLIVNFFQTQKIPPSDILCVFATAMVFEKEFDTQQVKDDVIQKFIELIPFDEVMNKKIMENKIAKVIGINKRMYDSFKEACEQLNSTISAVVAYSSLQSLLPQLAQQVDLPLMLTKFDGAKQFSLITAQQHETVTSSSSVVQPKKNNQLYLLLGVFGFLLIVLVLVIIMSSRSSTPTPVVRRVVPLLSPNVSKSSATVSAQPINSSTKSQ